MVIATSNSTNVNPLLDLPLKPPPGMPQEGGKTGRFLGFSDSEGERAEGDTTEEGSSIWFSDSEGTTAERDAEGVNAERKSFAWRCGESDSRSDARESSPWRDKTCIDPPPKSFPLSRLPVKILDRIPVRIMSRLLGGFGGGLGCRRRRQWGRSGRFRPGEDR